MLEGNQNLPISCYLKAEINEGKCSIISVLVPLHCLKILLKNSSD
jgi:hypothetical protein